MISIIVPAHNEALVIARTLQSLVTGAKPDELEILVVCNGCKDDTAQIASQFAPIVRVLETNIPSKSNALNIGDEAARGFPRFYLDGDVVVSLDSIRRIAQVLENGTALVAAPQVQFVTDQCSWFVKAYYETWIAMNAKRLGTSGAGLYALSQQGRSRFEKFPGITADDGYVQLLFAPSERTVVQGCRSLVVVPKGLRQLVKIKTRACFGDLELANCFPELQKNKIKGPGGSLKKMALDPRLWPRLSVYGYVRIASRLRGRWRWKFGDHRKWDRDDSSRVQPNASQSVSSTPNLR